MYRLNCISKPCCTQIIWANNLFKTLIIILDDNFCMKLWNSSSTWCIIPFLWMDFMNACLWVKKDGSRILVTEIKVTEIGIWYTVSFFQSQSINLSAFIFKGSFLKNIPPEASLKVTHPSKYTLSFSSSTAKGIKQLIQVTRQAFASCIFGSGSKWVECCVSNGIFDTPTGGLHLEVTFTVALSNCKSQTSADFTAFYALCEIYC